MNAKTGLTFAAGLRSMVRADPDMIMVGEIRDLETAQIAVESALTGHLVFTTLHTNDAPLAAARLIEMGIEPFLVASGVECVVAQRLVRRLCECKSRRRSSRELLGRTASPSNEDIKAFEPAGCVRCGRTGYRGRVGIYEVMPVTDEMRSLILDKAPAPTSCAREAREQGMRTMREDGIEKVGVGVTSVAEVLRGPAASAPRRCLDPGRAARRARARPSSSSSSSGSSSTSSASSIRRSASQMFFGSSGPCR